jgi:hypothetical protein
MPIIEGTKREKVWEGFYDFAVDGGAISTIPLRSNDGAIPAGADIISGDLDIQTTFTSGGAATIRGDSEGAGDLFAASAVAGFTAGRKNVLPADTTGSVTAATSVRTTVARVPALTIAAFALTAGKARLRLKWR